MAAGQSDCYRSQFSLKSNSDDDQGCEHIALALIFNLYRLPGLEIGQIAVLSPTRMTVLSVILNLQCLFFFE